jgi:(R,R)-butanediol dehydrogenase / meso-butanediol dehydrogenase / diacetyl reductase
MRAAVFHGPGDVRVETRADPAVTGPSDVVLRVLRASICGTDVGEYQHGPVLVPLREPDANSHHVGPLALGHEFVGIVEAIGEAVGSLRVGDRVVSGAGISCGTCSWCRRGRTNLCDSYYTIGLHADGGLADKVRVPAASCCFVPDACSDDDAALAQPLAVGIHALRRTGVGADDSLAVLGAGGIGTFVLAAASAKQLEPLIAVDVDPDRLERARRLGATHAIDARAANVAAEIRAATGDGASAVVEATGIPTGPATAMAAVRRGGTVVIVGLQPKPVEVDLLDLTLREVDLRPSMAHVFATDIPEALEILAQGRVGPLVTDRVIALEQLVEEGILALATGRARGKVIVDLTLAPGAVAATR